MSGSFTESIVEQAALARLESAGWQINALLAVSDGVEARVGTIGAGREWSSPGARSRARPLPARTCRS